MGEEFLLQYPYAWVAAAYGTCALPSNASCGIGTMRRQVRLQMVAVACLQIGALCVITVMCVCLRGASATGHGV